MSSTTTTDTPTPPSFTLAEPEPRHTRGAQTFLSFLDANPGQWAIYRRYNTSRRVARVKASQWRKQFGHLGYEFTHRIDAEGSTLYGRKHTVGLADNTQG